MFSLQTLLACIVSNEKTATMIISSLLGKVFFPSPLISLKISHFCFFCSFKIIGLNIVFFYIHPVLCSLIFLGLWFAVFH